MKIKAEIPQIFDYLYVPSRYKVAYGGRGSAKSWSYADGTLIKSSQKETRVLCTREVQKSIKKSVHQLLCDRIKALNIGASWNITNHEIKSYDNNSLFSFEGLLRNSENIKSYEGYDICWIEEGQSVSKDSLENVTATIRKPDSEIWITFNPKYEDDIVYERFVTHTPSNCISRLVNYMDNPYFPEVLRIEMEQDKKRDFLLYQQKWLGKPVGMGGKVFPEFDEKLHVKTFDRKLLGEIANCYMAMDPHSHFYPFCTWIALIPKNKRMNYPEDFHKHIYAEWPTFDMLQGYYFELRKKLYYQESLSDLAKQLYSKDGTEYGIKIRDRFIDSRYAKGAGSWNWSTSTQGIVELFAKPENGGLIFKCPPEKVIDAQKSVLHNDMLYNKHAPISEFNEPSFSIDPECRNTIISLKNHRLEEGTEKESEKYKDPLDTVRINFAGFHDFKYKNPKNEKVNSFSDWVHSPHGGKDSWMN